MKLKGTVSVLLSALMLFSVFSLSGCSENKSVYYKYKVDYEELLFEKDSKSYSEYQNICNSIDDAADEIILTPNRVKRAFSDEYLIKTDGITYAFIDENSKWVEWEVTARSDGMYLLNAEYKAVAGDGADICLALSLDGKYPYEELKNLTLPRLWEDECTKDFDKDSTGSDIRPIKKEVFKDLTSNFTDDNGYYEDGYKLALKKGKHTVRLTSVKNGVLVKSLGFKNTQSLVSYKDYIKQNENNENNAKENIVIEAEHPLYTNASNLYAVSDIQDVATTPNSPKETRLNAVGDTNWCHNGEEIIWETDVKESGLYSVNIRARQDYSEGMTAFRKLKVDGKVPFYEAGSVKFGYDFDWENVTLGEDKPQYIYLTKGKHTLSLTATPGNMSDILLSLENLVLDLNTVYRKIVVITGTTVDIYQDYSLDTKIPQLINSFKDCRNRIADISAKIKNTTGMGGSRASVLDEATELLDTFIAHPYKITGGLAGYKTKVEDIASLLTNMSEQALLVDKITLVPKGEKAPKLKAGFFKKCAFSIKKFAYSYVKTEDKAKTDKTIKVWVNTGRDQAQIIKQMVSNGFVNKTGVGVDLNIVDTGATLIQAALANKGPDVAIMIPQDTPVNLAMRGGLVDLKPLGTDEIYNNYYDSAWTPFKYLDGIYAVPETQIFDMMFVRDDIFEELGLTAPQTWEDFYACMKTVQNNNLIVGLPETNSLTIAISGGISTFQKFYFQNGGTFFNEDFSKTTFDSELSIDCLSRVCKLYTKFGLDRDVNFFNRFRSGELAFGIITYNTYNQLVAAAPEIDGLWSMYPIPGTKDKNGKINRAEASTGTASIILKAAKDKNAVAEAWQFVKWWNDAKIQGEYSERLEGAMGTAARYTPASKEAFDMVKWSKDERDALKMQWEQVMNVREIPGNYYISRALTSAIRNTISKGTSVRFNIAKYNADINSEIKRKRIEFGLEEEGEQ